MGIYGTILFNLVILVGFVVLEIFVIVFLGVFIVR